MRLLAAAVGVLTFAAAGPAAAQDAAAFGVAPWAEAVISVREIARSSAFLLGGGWRVVAEGTVARSELAYWRLPTTATARFARLCARGATTGCVRFVHFVNAGPQRPIRLAARPWDTGGIFSVMLRTDNVQREFDRAIALGWWAESEPYPLEFGGSRLINVVVEGPNGVNYALYERSTPRFTAFAVTPLSQGFNAMRMVADQPSAVRFYRDRLGFRAVFDAPFVDPRAQPTNFSVPANLAPTLVRRAAALGPGEGESGRVEVMQLEGFVGRTFAALASPPNFGIISLRYPVADLVGYLRTIERRDVHPAYAANRVVVAGLGTLDLVAVRDPDGNLTEFFHAD